MPDSKSFGVGGKCDSGSSVVRHDLRSVVESKSIWKQQANCRIVTKTLGV